MQLNVYKNDMDKKTVIENFKIQALNRWQKKIWGLAQLEAKIQADIREYSELNGVKIIDIQLYDPETGEIQFETDL